MKWLRSRDHGEAASSDPDQVRIFTDEIELRGTIAPTGQRVTDILLRGQDLAFLPTGADPSPEAWVSVAPHEILFVVPPPLGTAASGRRDYRLIPVAIDIGPYRLTGRIHVPPDQEASPSDAARQSFLPMTDATIERPGTAPETVAVAIVNMTRSSGPRFVDASGS